MNAPAPPPARDDRTAYALLFAVPLCLSVNPLVSKAFIGDIPPWGMAFWRWTLAAALIAIFAGRALWRRRAAVRAEWRSLAALGFLGVFVAGAFVYIAAQTTTATNIGLLFALSPVFVVLIGAMLYGDRLGHWQIAGVAGSLLGAVLILMRGDLAALLGLRFASGDLWILIACICWSFYTVYNMRWKSALGLWPRFLAIMLAGTLMLAPFALWEHIAARRWEPDGRNLGAIVALAVFPAVLAYSGYAFIIARLGAARAILMQYIVPVYIAAFAWLALGERLAWYHIAGAALVLGGLFLATRRAPRKS